MKSQLRQHIKFTFWNRMRLLIQKSRGLKVHGKIYIDNNVKFLRYPHNIEIDEEVIVKEGARICSCNNNATIKIGKNTTVGYHTFIFASNAISIGNDCLIAPFVYIVDSNHQAKRNQLINQQPNVTAPIIIEDDVWIASNVTITKGVTIGKGAVIGANSVVNSNVPPYAIYAGTPAREIGVRV